MESSDGQIQHVTTTLEFASPGARLYIYRYTDLHDIAFVFHGRMSMILFVTISLQGRLEGSGTVPD